uniref:Chromo domain-containing protein n=1 Tax=Panagrolaimus davidi TaxID=227884 RepID=A0A914PP95_9BILA
MGGTILWDENEIQEIVRSRSCLQGDIEYFIIWKNGERPTWELRDSFTSKKLFDEFDRKALKKATSWAPIFNAEQNFIKHKYAIRKKNRKNVKTEEPSPSDVTGCIDVNGRKFAVVSFYKSPSQLIRWDIFKNDHPELAEKFMESRCLKDILN